MPVTGFSYRIINFTNNNVQNISAKSHKILTNQERRNIAIKLHTLYALM